LIKIARLKMAGDGVFKRQFLRPATGVFQVASAALEGGRELFFIRIFGGFLKPPKIWAFFSD